MHPAVKQLSSSILAGTFVAGLALWQLVHFSWIGDDAAITLRTVLNFSWGFGPVFNIGERVQAYTHPLWFLLLYLSYLAIGNLLLATFLLSMVVSLLVALILTQVIASSFWTGFAALGILLTAKSYIDYTSSGLENPISHLTLLASILTALNACRVKSPSSFTYFILTASLAYLSRADLVLMVAPLALYVTLVVRLPICTLIKALLVGALPALTWTTFSVFYYGFPVPNTAYAKLATGMSRFDSFQQGLHYFRDSLNADPVTLMTISAAIVVGLFSSPVDRALVAGVTFYLIYIMRIGGDFMSGRFFTAPLIVSLAILARNQFGRRWIAAGLLLCGICYIPSSMLNTKKERLLGDYGIADERLFYSPERTFRAQFPNFGELDGEYHSLPYDSKPTRVMMQCGGLGYSSLKMGPRYYFIDQCALADPLLARLPALPHARVGHWERAIPTNYPFSVYANKNALIDEELRRYYEDLRVITRDSLFSAERLKTIVRFNLQKAPNLSRWRDPSRREPRATEVAYEDVEASRLATVPRGGALWDAPGNIVMYGKGIILLLPTAEKLHVIDVSLDGNDLYKFEYFDGTSFKELFNLGPFSDPEMAQYVATPTRSGLVHYRRTVPSDLPPTTRLRITAVEGDLNFSIGHLATR